MSEGRDFDLTLEYGETKDLDRLEIQESGTSDSYYISGKEIVRQSVYSATKTLLF